jgi:hypothetical protein
MWFSFLEFLFSNPQQPYQQSNKAVYIFILVYFIMMMMICKFLLLYSSLALKIFLTHSLMHFFMYYHDKIISWIESISMYLIRVTVPLSGAFLSTVLPPQNLGSYSSV